MGCYLKQHELQWHSFYAKKDILLNKDDTALEKYKTHAVQKHMQNEPCL